jgi:ubiquinone/menaquinone biosynthesis C-methylase UbiE
MSLPIPDSQSKSGYVVDAENIAEMARLTKQAHMLSENLGLLPANIEIDKQPRILDIGCGPGEWTLEMARRFPGGEIIGIDISELMISYARYMAESQDLSNVTFYVKDARQALDFPDNTFDLISARFIIGFMSTAIWPKLLYECFRLLHPGGIFCNSEPESLGTTTSPALGRYNMLVTEAMRRVGKCFTPYGEQYGITAMQPQLFQMAGFQNMQTEAFVIHYSTGMPAHDAMVDNFKTFLKLLQPLLVSNELISQLEVERLYAQTLEEMASEEFHAAAFFQRVSGQKPDRTS